MSDNSKLWDNIIFLMTWSWWPNVSVKLQRWLSSANWQGYVLNGRRLDWFSGGCVWGARRRYLYFLASNGPTKIRMVEFFEVLACFRGLLKSVVWFTTDSERGEMGARSVEELSQQRASREWNDIGTPLRMGYEMLVDLMGIRVLGLEKYAYSLTQ